MPTMTIKFRAPVPMKPKMIGKCCVCHPRKKAGKVWAKDANHPTIGTCERCGTMQTFTACTLSLTLDELKKQDFALKPIGK